MCVCTYVCVCVLVGGEEVRCKVSVLIGHVRIGQVGGVRGGRSKGGSLM